VCRGNLGDAHAAKLTPGEWLTDDEASRATATRSCPRNQPVFEVTAQGVHGEHRDKLAVTRNDSVTKDAEMTVLRAPVEESRPATIHPAPPR
jgi:hypothetical protein